jgi:hypothetical protein
MGFSHQISIPINMELHSSLLDHVSGIIPIVTEWLRLLMVNPTHPSLSPQLCTCAHSFQDLF